MKQTNDMQESLTTAEMGKHRMLSSWWRYSFLAFSLAGIIIAVLQIFLIVPMFTNFYLYFLFAVFLSPVFIIFPANKRAPSDKIPWYDSAFACMTLGISIYLMIYAFDITERGWSFGAPLRFTVLSLIFVPISLEAVRRTGGLVLFLFTSFFAAYPLFAEYMPGILSGGSFPLWAVMDYHVLSTDSLLGLPMQVVGTLVIGYIIFGVVIMATGGGRFFLDLALALFGTQRGGPAKVAVFASGLFGSLSGSVISNVITTGSFTIPAMKRIGYTAHYAGAIEACASTGGCIMPPVMGTVAFVMASMLNISYWEVVIAAIIPAILYYVALFVQVDSYAGRIGLKGMDRSEIPQIKSVLKEGWPCIAVFLLLIYLIYQQREAEAPFFASAALLAISMARSAGRFDLKGLVKMVEEVGKLLVEITAILAACGYILGAFSMTGVGSSFAREIVMLAGETGILMLIFGAIASYLLGMGMTITSCYIFLAIILAPGLVKIGFSLIASHLFVLYWGLTSFITPPVALGAYAAAGIAGASAMKTGYTSMRLGIILYLVPFFFIYNPALVFEGAALKVAYSFCTAVIGVILLASGLEGYLVKVGTLSKPVRAFLFLAGLTLIKPGWISDVCGLGLAVGTVAVQKILMRRRLEKSLSTGS